MRKTKFIVPVLIFISVGIGTTGLIYLIQNNQKQLNQREYVNIEDVAICKEEVVEEEVDPFTVQIVEKTDYSYAISTKGADIPRYSESSYTEMVGTQLLYDEMLTDDEDFEKVSREGLVDWAFRAYNEGWQYVYGGCQEGYVDCSGLIKSYVGVCARGTEELLAQSTNKGPISTIPEIPGLGIYRYGHVGIYVGNGMVIDARNERDWVCYDSIDYMAWEMWFEIKGVEYEYDLE